MFLPTKIVKDTPLVQLGPQFVARAACCELGMDRILAEAGLHAPQDATAQLLVANRLIHIRKATLPDVGQMQEYRQLGIDWKSEFTRQK